MLYVVGEVPEVPGSSWSSLTESERKADYKKYIYNDSQIVFVFPKLTCFLNQVSNDSDYKQLKNVIKIQRTSSNYSAAYTKRQEIQTGRHGLNIRFIHLICIPPNAAKHQRLLEFFQYQKNISYEPSEKVFYSIDAGSEFTLEASEDDSISGKDYKDFAYLHFKLGGSISVPCFNFNLASEKRYYKQYLQFSESLDQLKSHRIELSKVSFNLSMCFQSRQMYFKEKGLGMQLFYLIQNIRYAVESTFWNPKRVKSYLMIETACKAVCDLMTPYFIAGSKGGNTLAGLIEFERKNLLSNLNQKLPEEFDFLCIYDQPDNVKQLLKNLFEKYEHFLVRGTVEQRNVFEEEFYKNSVGTANNSCLKSCLLKAKLSLYVMMKFPITNGDCYKHVIATLSETIKRANYQRQLFESFTEDKVLSDLVLYDIGYRLLQKK